MLPSGCYHCYKCSGPHNHTLSPLNNPNTARHPHRYHLIAFFFFFAFIAMATAIQSDCVAGLSLKRNHDVQCLFLLFHDLFRNIWSPFLSLLRRCSSTLCLQHQAPSSVCHYFAPWPASEVSQLCPHYFLNNFDRNFWHRLLWMPSVFSLKLVSNITTLYITSMTKYLYLVIFRDRRFECFWG